jgi:hypothetical protein
MARKPQKKLPMSDRGVPVSTRPAMPWATTPGMYIAGKEALDAADALGVEMDRYWGVARLRLLVDGALREKFDRQRYLLSQARWEGTLEDVKRESARMVTAYRALDAAAKASGAAQVDDSVWEVGIPTGILEGSVLSVVRNDEAMAKVVAEGRNVIVMTLDEVARYIGQDRDLLEIKKTFPGAQIKRAEMPRDPVSPSLAEWDEGMPDVKAPIDGVMDFGDLNDEVPF